MPETLGQDVILINENEIPTELILNLLETNHCSCVQLFERFLAYLQDKENSYGKFICLSDPYKSTLYGFIFASNAGFVLHTFATDLSKPVVLNIINLLSDFFSNRKLYCISGEALGTNIIALALKKCGKFPEPVAQRKYTLMEFNKNSSIIPDNTDFQIVPCNESHLEQIYPLQAYYDQIEVLPPNQPFNQDLCRKNLTKALKQNRVFGIYCNNEFIAKASINGISEKFWQIGGVFTKNEYRGKGCASNLTRHIASQAMLQGKRTVLFVKNGNTPAEKAYAKAGFMPIGKYEIFYY